MTRRRRSSRGISSAVQLVLIVITLVAVCFSAGCSGNPMNGNTIIVPRIVPVDGAEYPPSPSYSFPFEDATISLTFAVDGTVYAGAKAADKEVTVFGNVPESEWMARSYRAMIDDPNQDQFYAGLQEQLRAVRSEMSLSDDEFADLMAVFVQSIPYETTPENPAKFPIETFAEKSGDCDDKSLLLAALLSREGYGTALLSFPNESHMAVGIACDGSGYHNTGYSYIETTNLSFIGVPPDGLGAGVTLASDPLIIPVGSGNMTYNSCGQTSSLHALYESTGDRFYNLSHRADEMRADLKGLSENGDVYTYNQKVREFNGLIAEMNRVAAVHNFIAGHQYDRKGTYEWVTAHPL